MQRIVPLEVPDAAVCEDGVCQDGVCEVPQTSTQTGAQASAEEAAR